MSSPNRNANLPDGAFITTFNGKRSTCLDEYVSLDIDNTLDDAIDTPSASELITASASSSCNARSCSSAAASSTTANNTTAAATTTSCFDH
ncbi:hypothetical protein CLIM01_14848 [Colletotrichum limetticola]|uniref:Uncharacterized protein n=1 Tax=Colletotrichum limetticola TaxID=1209924 RepID=A0ABQ9P6R5_9PEZI|nr:hypothetical protein CLIM01_14848 [Colletotrichum limetticola]